jgi:hypothetical protein
LIRALHQEHPMASHCSRARTSFLIAAVAGLALAAPAVQADFTPGNLLVSRSVYTGTAQLIAVGQALPGGGAAVADGSYPYVWQNEGPDPSFGVTAPIFLDEITPAGARVGTVALDTSLITTSFSSKSEMGLNVSPDGRAVTLMGYAAPVNMLDVSNSNTPGHTDPTNPVGLFYQRAIAKIDLAGNLDVTAVNAYSGNNGRGAVLAGGNYYLVGNAGNSGSGPTGATLGMLSDNTGVQMIAAGGNGETTVVGAVQGTLGSTNGYQHGYSVTQYGFAADKTGKDDNFRGLTVFESTMYVSKGSGSNGINTVFQVGDAGSLPTLANAGTTPIAVLPGLPTGLARNISATSPQTEFYPFGLWFADAATLYVGDEGSGGNSGSNTPAANPHAGLQKWILSAGQWHLAYTLQAGLDLGVPYSVADAPNGTPYPPALYPATDGLRNIAGVVNGNGTVTVYGVTSTVSTATDQGADPNKLVVITDALSASTLPADEAFTTLATAGYGEVLRGVAVVPACYANCDASTAPPVLNVNDFLCFQSRFAAGDSYANCDQSTTAPVLNVNDFLCFQAAFAAGCP